MTSGYVPLHLQSQIRDLIGNKHLRPRGVADENNPDDPHSEDSDDPNQRNIRIGGKPLFQHECRIVDVHTCRRKWLSFCCRLHFRLLDVMGDF